MKKAFDQTVRDLKREVNKKVLKVPGIEQKILDATSNEPWGPHGSYLAEISQASRNYHEYQLIMSIIWKRINDTGKNWRHVYKGLTVLEYLVAHGSERVIDDIKEHAYQISTLSDFQYIDSRGRDQGNNVRKKSQSLVALVNDKERIKEIREKALANKDKYQSTFSTSGMRRSSSGGGYGDRYDDDRYDSQYRDGDRNGYSREKDGGYRDDDRYGRNRDSYSHDGDRNGRDPDRYGRDDYRDEDRQGRSRNDDYQTGSRSRSLDRDRGHSFDDDQHSSRSAGGRAGDSSLQDDRHPGKKLPEQSVGAPPSYEEAVKSAQDRIDDERDEKASAVITDSTANIASPPKVFSESANSGPASVGTSVLPNKNEDDSFDEFDPRSSIPATANNVDMDLFGSFSVDDSMNSLALVSVDSAATTLEADIPIESGFSNNYMAMPSTSSVFSQPNRNPFGDAPFRAISQDNFCSSQNVTSFVSSQTIPASANGSVVQPILAMVEPSTGFDFGESFKVTNAPSTIPNQQPAATQYVASQVSNDSSTIQNFHHPPVTPMLANQPSSDMLNSIFNLSSGLAPPVSSSSMPPAPTRSMTAPPEFLSQPFLPQSVPQETSLNQFVHPGIQPLAAAPNSFPQSGMPTQMFPQNNFNQRGFPSTRSSPDLLNPLLLGAPMASQATASALPPTTAQSKEKFNTKSTVWADTLNRGLIDLNISGSTTVDIGVDFDSINRREKLKEKKNISATPVSTITMGKAMGSGSGAGRSGASGLAPSANPMMAPRMGMSMGGSGMDMSAYGGGMNQSMGMGVYAGGVNQTMGIGMNVGMGQGAAMRPGFNMPQSQGVPGVGYNPMMGMGGYVPQQPYGGYR